MTSIRPSAGRRRGGTMSAWWGSCLAGLVVLAAAAPIASAQGTANPARYQVMARDILRVDVSGRNDITGQYTVDVDGQILLPALGMVPAAGRTTNEIATDISRRLSLISREIPQVSVSVVESSSGKYFVLGAVLLPGAYNFAQPPTPWEAISKAGGSSEDANLSAVEIISPTGLGPTVVDVAAAIRGGTLASLPRLHPGDTVRVPRATDNKISSTSVVYVFGAVGTQGPQPLSDAPDLVQALIRSGPAADADFGSVEIVRKDGSRVVSMKVNMNDYFNGANVTGNPELQPGDTVRLPHQPHPIGVFGALALLGTIVGLTTSILVLANNSH